MGQEARNVVRDSVFGGVGIAGRRSLPHLEGNAQRAELLAGAGIHQLHLQGGLVVGQERLVEGEGTAAASNTEGQV
jgi:hypothetical protein